MIAIQNCIIFNMSTLLTADFKWHYASNPSDPQAHRNLNSSY